MASPYQVSEPSSCLLEGVWMRTHLLLAPVLMAEVLDLDEDDLEVFSNDASLMDMNSFSTMMPTSPLSMISQIKFEDEQDLKEFFVTVDEPESHVTTIETVITYRIITKTSCAEFDSSEFKVRRCQKTNSIDKIAQNFQGREYFDEMKECGPIHILWSVSEEDLVDNLKDVASCIDRCCKATEKLMFGLSEALLLVVHEYVLYSEMLVGVMKRRDQTQAELDSKVEALTYKKTDSDLLTEEIGKLEVEYANNALKA
ncbi:hypothetical protein H8959_003238 [Pygathrix nigripes]